MNMFVLFNIVSGNVANLALRILDAKPSFNLKAWFSIYNSKTKFASLPRTILINTNIFNFKIEVSRKKCKKNPGQPKRVKRRTLPRNSFCSIAYIWSSVDCQNAAIIIMGKSIIVPADVSLTWNLGTWTHHWFPVVIKFPYFGQNNVFDVGVS